MYDIKALRLSEVSVDLRNYGSVTPHLLSKIQGLLRQSSQILHLGSRWHHSGYSSLSLLEYNSLYAKYYLTVSHIPTELLQQMKLICFIKMNV